MGRSWALQIFTKCCQKFFFDSWFSFFLLFCFVCLLFSFKFFFCTIGFVCCLKLRTCVNTQSWSLSFNSSSVDTNDYFFTKLNILSKEYVINLLLLIRVKWEWSKASFAVSETIFENEGEGKGTYSRGTQTKFWPFTVVVK